MSKNIKHQINDDFEIAERKIKPKQKKKSFDDYDTSYDQLKASKDKKHRKVKLVVDEERW